MSSVRRSGSDRQKNQASFPAPTKNHIMTTILNNVPSLELIQIPQHVHDMCMMQNLFEIKKSSIVL